MVQPKNVQARKLEFGPPKLRAEGHSQFLKVALDLHMHAMAHWPPYSRVYHTHVHTHTFKKILEFPLYAHILW